jgi:hypothetical protein
MIQSQIGEEAKAPIQRLVLRAMRIPSNGLNTTRLWDLDTDLAYRIVSPGGRR